MDSASPFSRLGGDCEPVVELARRHGLELSERGDINELGLDFQVVTAIDHSGVPWVLRIPRRSDVTRKIEREARTLSLLKGRMPFAVPDWRIVSTELVAYPKLNDPTAICVDSDTHDLIWNIDRESGTFDATLGHALAALHALPIEAAIESGMRTSTPKEAREQVAREIDQVKNAFGIDPQLERRVRMWVDDDTTWPTHSVVVHGDLYAGHILVNDQSAVTGIIDWTETEINDPSIDLCSHLLLFGETGLNRLLRHYEAEGGKVWPRMAHHIAERLATTPIKYALFALETGESTHLELARTQLLQTMSD